MPSKLFIRLRLFSIFDKCVSFAVVLTPLVGLLIVTISFLPLSKLGNGEILCSWLV